MTYKLPASKLIVVLAILAAAGLSACSTPKSNNNTSRSQSHAYAPNAQSSLRTPKKQTQKKQLQSQKKKKVNSAKQKLAEAKEELAAKKKRLERHDRIVKPFSDRQKVYFKPRRDALQKQVDEAAKLVKKLTPVPKRPKIKARVSSKGKGLDSLIAKYARENGVPLNLAHAVVRVESTYRAHARGAAGEIGLMQLKLATARMMGYRGSASALYDPATNLKYGMKYLGKAHRLAGGSTCGTILRYNAGHGAKKMNPTSARYCRRVKRFI